MVDHEEIFIDGKVSMVELLTLNGGQRLSVTGRGVKTARLRDELFEDLVNPKSLIQELKRLPERKPDIFTFWQRPPDTEPRHSYLMEWEPMSFLPIRDYQYWSEKQIPKETRKNIRRAENRGVSIATVSCDDELIRGIVEIYNESPVKRGKRFWHYGKGFDEVKHEVARDLDRSEFVCAYFERQLIGFYKLVYDDRIAHPVLSISKMAHRDKKTDDALIASAVRACERRGISFLGYGAWRRGTHAEFLQRHGFEKTLLPRYYVPLTAKGWMVLKLGLHRGFFAALPESVKTLLLRLRSWWYQRGVSSQQSES